MNKSELLNKCKEMGILKCSSKNKSELIQIIQKTTIIIPSSPPSPPSPSPKNNTTTKLKFIDLFCGIGGFHQALKNMDGECVFASDIDEN